MFVPGRTADVYDLMADAAGALAGTIACVGVGSLRARHKAQALSFVTCALI